MDKPQLRFPGNSRTLHCSGHNETRASSSRFRTVDDRVDRSIATSRGRARQQARRNQRQRWLGQTQAVNYCLRFLQTRKASVLRAQKSARLSSGAVKLPIHSIAHQAGLAGAATGCDSTTSSAGFAGFVAFRVFDFLYPVSSALTNSIRASSAASPKRC